MLKLLYSKDGFCAVNQPLATRLPPTYTWLRWDPTRPLWPPNQFLYCRHIPTWGASRYLLNWKSESQSVRPPLLHGYWNSTDTRAGSKPRGGNTKCHDYIQSHLFDKVQCSTHSFMTTGDLVHNDAHCTQAQECFMSSLLIVVLVHQQDDPLL